MSQYSGIIKLVGTDNIKSNLSGSDNSIVKLNGYKANISKISCILEGLTSVVYADISGNLDLNCNTLTFSYRKSIDIGSLIDENGLLDLSNLKKVGFDNNVDINQVLNLSKSAKYNINSVLDLIENGTSMSSSKKIEEVGTLDTVVELSMTTMVLTKLNELYSNTLSSMYASTLNSIIQRVV